MENFNKIFNKNFNHKGPQEPYLFLDAIMNEAVTHENYINKINSLPYPNSSKKYLIGKSFSNNDNVLNDEITKIISELSKTDYNSDEERLDNQSVIENENSATIVKINKWFINNKYSCYYDSFYTIFIFSILKYIDEEIENKKINKTKNNDIYYRNL